MSNSYIHSFLHSPSWNTIPLVGDLSTAWSAGLLAERTSESRVNTAMIRLSFTNLCNLAKGLILSDSGDRLASSTPIQMKATVIAGAIGVSARGLRNIYSGIQNQDSRQGKKGALQFGAGVASSFVIANMHSSVVSSVSVLASSCWVICSGIKKIANGERIGKPYILLGVASAAYGAAFAYMQFAKPQSVEPQVVGLQGVN